MQAELQGSQVGFAFEDGRGLTGVAGRVNGDRIEATVTRNGRTSKYIGTRARY
jgi:hypothetical protein